MFNTLRPRALAYAKSASKSTWLFPALLLIVLISFTLSRVHGSSISVNSMLYSAAEQDPDLLAGAPRGVRSDEWLVNTQMTIAQANSGFQRINENVADGQDMSLIMDTPYREWSIAFKPQNLAFFVMPLEYAFAFKWWLLLFLLIVGCYFFVLELFPKKILQSALLALFVGLTPMVFWWYQSATILPIAYSFFMMVLLMRIFKADGRRMKLVYSLLLAYISICFGLLLYPPFQIPCAIAVVVFTFGWWLENYTTRDGFKKLVTLWPYWALTALLTLSVGALFYLTRKDVIKTIQQTVYPGSRVITSGGAPPLLAFSSFLSPNLQYDEKAAAGYLNNQSEASNFILIAPYLFLPSLYLIVRAKRRRQKIPWGLLLINVLLAAFLARMYVETAWLEPLYKLVLLDKVPNTRLLIGVGFVGVLQLILLMKTLDKSKLGRIETWVMAILGAGCALVVMLLIGNYTIDHFPIFIASSAKVLLFSVWIAGGIFLILRKRFILGLGALICFSVLSVYRVNPLYQGLAPVTEIELIQILRTYPDDGDWAVLDDRLLINHPIMAGKDSISTVHFYPQLELWEELDKDRAYGDIYNRYAHVMFSDDEAMTDPFVLLFADIFIVKFDPCGEFLQNNAKYALTEKPLASTTCVSLDRYIDLPKKDFYIYEITPPVSTTP